MIKDGIREALIVLLQKAVRQIAPGEVLSEMAQLYLDVPQQASHGDLSSNLALKLAKHLKKNPHLLAESLRVILDRELANSRLTDVIDKIQIDGPGFINFFIKDGYFYNQIVQIIKQDSNFGRLTIGKKQKARIEFVSANPTGPLSVAHARQAAVGDSLFRIMEFLGFKAMREYYLNDEGNQIDILGRSIELRLRELNGERVEFFQSHYQGDYITDMAIEIKDSYLSGRQAECKIQNFDFANYGLKYILNSIKKDLIDFGVKFDIWVSQAALRKSGKIERVIRFLRKKGFIYEHQGAVWFKSRAFGDDKDRVIIKSDKSYTYLAPDIAYHDDKFKRGVNRVINLWGPDHHGYISRINAAVEALGRKKGALSIVIVQLVTLLREGQPIPMSTRKGCYVTLRQIIDEIGKDAARFFLVARRISSHLDFDLELAKKESNENPVYYIQYAFARISSILRRRTKDQLKVSCDLNPLKKPEELSLVRKLSQFPHILKSCFDMLDPCPLTLYLLELAGDFHKFYDKYKVLDSLNPDLSRARISLVRATRVVLRNGLSLLGLSAPEKM